MLGLSLALPKVWKNPQWELELPRPRPKQPSDFPEASDAPRLSPPSSCPEPSCPAWSPPAQSLRPGPSHQPRCGSSLLDRMSIAGTHWIPAGPRCPVLCQSRKATDPGKVTRTAETGGLALGGTGAVRPGGHRPQWDLVPFLQDQKVCRGEQTRAQRAERSAPSPVPLSLCRRICPCVPGQENVPGHRSWRGEGRAPSAGPELRFQCGWDSGEAGRPALTPGTLMCAAHLLTQSTGSGAERTVGMASTNICDLLSEDLLSFFCFSPQREDGREKNK
ncbi:uncharacterized protein LOC111719570 [Sarcophilus harrisii]|uniref:uncharacterized protein LOC111719570 n=1 Tax=Sarcophilus harrisii TaxID=9305 RepID=UPI001301D5F1|nr:uncharacterized protein LOC111719570 [Sarcophilus harrisii]